MRAAAKLLAEIVGQRPDVEPAELMIRSVRQALVQPSSSSALTVTSTGFSVDVLLQARQHVRRHAADLLGGEGRRQLRQ